MLRRHVSVATTRKGSETNGPLSGIDGGGRLGDREPPTAFLPRQDLSAQQLALITDRLLPQRADEVGDRLSPQAPAVHAVDPVRVEGLDSIDDVPDRLIVSEDPDLAVVV